MASNLRCPPNTRFCRHVRAGRLLGSVNGWGNWYTFVAAEPRITAAVFGLAGLLPNHDTLANAAAQITIPLEFAMQWDDELISRGSAIALFDAFGSQEKTLHANLGGHVNTPHRS